MTSIIVEEDHQARVQLRRLAAAVDDLKVSAEYSSALEVSQQTQGLLADFILLDADASDGSGLELARQLRNNDPLVIFTAARKQYAAEAFDLDAVDYLLKPVSPERFFHAIGKVRELLRTRTPVRKAYEDHLFIRDSTILRRLRLEDVLFAEAMGDYVKVHTRQRTYCAHARFGAVAEQLPAARFIRVHRSFIVALDKIDNFQDGGVFVDEKFVPVTETYRKALINRIRVI
jgi:DNA-binding LytR/AlgR family response regulator